jgi:hypothetical protein
MPYIYINRFLRPLPLSPLPLLPRPFPPPPPTAQRSYYIQVLPFCISSHPVNPWCQYFFSLYKGYTQSWEPALETVSNSRRRQSITDTRQSGTKGNNHRQRHLTIKSQHLTTDKRQLKNQQQIPTTDRHIRQPKSKADNQQSTILSPPVQTLHSSFGKK